MVPLTEMEGELGGELDLLLLGLACRLGAMESKWLYYDRSSDKKCHDQILHFRLRCHFHLR